MERSTVRTSLIKILQRAYSGEKAAALAYRGHWKSLSEADEIARIRRIEAEEWTHRAIVGRMLNALEAKPVRSREMASWAIGRLVGLLCHISGWFLAMYFAGKLESANTEEYGGAAALAGMLDLTEFYRELMAMSVVEKEHEMFFLNMASGHRAFPMCTRLFRWGGASPERTGCAGASRSERDFVPRSMGPVQTALVDARVLSNSVK